MYCFAEFDFVGASIHGNQPLLVPGGRGGYDTDGAMFVSIISGLRGGLAPTLPAAEITIVTVRKKYIRSMPNITIVTVRQ
jgi:hypothetical protein